MIYDRVKMELLTLTDNQWHTIDRGEYPYINGDWKQLLKYRTALFIRNQGVNNDNVTPTIIEVYFNNPNFIKEQTDLTKDEVSGNWIFQSQGLVPTIGTVVRDVDNTSEAIVIAVDDTNAPTYILTLDKPEVLIANDGNIHDIFLINTEYIQPSSVNIGLKLSLGDTLSIDVNDNVVLWARSDTINSTLVLIQGG